MANTPVKEQRAERHLMRMRGAGPRAIASGFDFAFTSVPLPSDQVRHSVQKSREIQSAQKNLSNANDSYYVPSQQPPSKRAKLDALPSDATVSGITSHSYTAEEHAIDDPKNAITSSKKGDCQRKSSSTADAPSKRDDAKERNTSSDTASSSTRSISRMHPQKAIVHKDGTNITTCKISARRKKPPSAMPDTSCDQDSKSSVMPLTIKAREPRLSCNDIDAQGVHSFATMQEHSLPGKLKSQTRIRERPTKHELVKGKPRPVLEAGDVNRKTLPHRAEAGAKPSKSRNNHVLHSAAITSANDDQDDPLSNGDLPLSTSKRAAKIVDLMDRAENAVSKDGERQKSLEVKTASASARPGQSRLAKTKFFRHEGSVLSRGTISKTHRKHGEMAPCDDDIDLDDLITNIATLTKRSHPR